MPLRLAVAGVWTHFRFDRDTKHPLLRLQGLEDVFCGPGGPGPHAIPIHRGQLPPTRLAAALVASCTDQDALDALGHRRYYYRDGNSPVRAASIRIALTLNPHRSRGARFTPLPRIPQAPAIVADVLEASGPQLVTHGHPAAGKVLAGHLRAYSSSWKPFARFVQQHRLTPDQVEKFIGPDANRFVQGVAYAPGVATVRDEYLDACRSRDHATQTVVEGSFDNIDSARNLLGDIAPSWKGDAGCVVELLKDLTDKG